jgi:nucleoid-associated protein YgaU
VKRLISKSDDVRRNALVGATLLIVAAAFLYLWFMPDEVVRDAPVVTEAASEQAKAAQNAAEIVPAFDLVRISRGGTGVIAGRMAPGSKVELLANGKKISEVVADANGEWVMILEEPLEAGSVELNLTARAADGAMAEAENIVVVSVPERENDRFLERQQNGVVAVLSPKDGEGGSTVLQKPGVAAFAEVGESLSLETVDFGDGGEPVFAGRSLPRVDVRLYLDDTYIGNVRADDTGRWQVPLVAGGLTMGAHSVRLDQVIGDGQVQLRVEQPFETGQPIDPKLASGGVFVRPGNTLWQIARQLYGSGVRYTLIFRENSEQIRDPDMIYPGQIFKLPQKSDAG